MIDESGPSIEGPRPIQPGEEREIVKGAEDFLSKVDSSVKPGEEKEIVEEAETFLKGVEEVQWQNRIIDETKDEILEVIPDDDDHAQVREFYFEPAYRSDYRVRYLRDESPDKRARKSALEFARTLRVETVERLERGAAIKPEKVSEFYTKYILKYGSNFSLEEAKAAIRRDAFSVHQIALDETRNRGATPG